MLKTMEDARRRPIAPLAVKVTALAVPCPCPFQHPANANRDYATSVVWRVRDWSWAVCCDEHIEQACKQFSK